jgi:hypothetical protein
MTKYATVASLSPEAREFYETSVEKLGKTQSKMWLRYGYYVLDDDMNPVPAPFVEWAVMYDGKNRGERQIRIDLIGDWFISTVFLGLDHGYGDPDDPEYRPVLFETMIFWQGEEGKCPHPELHNDQDRYTSTQDAILGHAFMVDKVVAVTTK